MAEFSVFDTGIIVARVIVCTPVLVMALERAFAVPKSAAIVS